MAGGAYSALSGLRTRLATRSIARNRHAGRRLQTAACPVGRRRPDFSQVLRRRRRGARTGLSTSRGVMRPPARLDVALGGRGFSRSRPPTWSATRATVSSRGGRWHLVTRTGESSRESVAPWWWGRPHRLRARRQRPAGGVPPQAQVVDFGDYVAAPEEAAAPAEAGSPWGLPGVARPRRRARVVERPAARADGAAHRGLTRLRSPAARHHHADERRRRSRHLGAGPALVPDATAIHADRGVRT